MKLNAKSVREKFLFVAGAFSGPEKYLFVAHDEQLANKGKYRTSLLLSEGKDWEELAVFDWQCVGLSAGESLVVVLGRDGQVGILENGKARQEKLDPKRAVGPLRGIDLIGSVFYAYGMKREIFRRDSSGVWQWFNKGMAMVLPKGKVDVKALITQGIKDMGGINSLSAASESMYAFGMRGEIWRLSADTWKKVDSPTNLMLSDSVARQDGTIFACGQVGMLLKGKNDRWVQFDYDGPDKLDFSAIADFQKKIFLADGHSLRVLNGSTLEVVDFGGEGMISSSALHSTRDELLSVAAKEVFRSDDGKTWSNLLEP